MKLIFMGTPEFAVPSLKALLATGHEIMAVFTQPDKPVGRKQIITPPPVKVLALEHDLKVYQPTKIKTAEARAAFEPLLQSAEAACVAAYGRILPDWMLVAPQRGCINVHSSLLPKYRGAAPINWAIVNGERETGVTIMKMDVGMDTGDVLQMIATPIGAKETAAELTPRLAELGATLLVDTLKRLDEITPQPQDHARATHAPMLKREDGLVDWTMSAQQIEARQRGFHPFPGCYTMLGEQRLELVAIEVEAGDVQAPGTVVEIKKDSFVVACGNQSRLRITQIQPAGKKIMPARDFLNGAKLAVGSKLG
jgi:methionyl-tRNA formyltransferase